MERLKRYMASIAVAAVAVVFLIIGALALTVFRPAQELSSSVTPSSAIVMTRDGVLRLVDGENVTVTATSASGAEVALGLGTPGDVVGWIGDDSYTEIVGLTSEREVLKTIEHAERTSTDTQSGGQSGAQSGGQSGAQSGGQSGAQPDSAGLVEDLASSDMWLTSVSKDGSASLELTKVPSDRSLIAVSAGPVGDLTLTLTWPTQRMNLLALGSFLSAIVLALVALVAFISRFHTLRNRRARADRLAMTAGADVTDTQAIDTAKIAEMVEIERAAADVEGADEVDNDGGIGVGVVEDKTVETTRTVEYEGPDEEPDQVASDESAEVEESPVETGAADDVEATSHSGSEQWSDSLAAVNADDESDGAPQNEPAETDSSDTPAEPIIGVDARSEPEPVVRGRHGVPSESFDEDPPEIVPTDTAIIDLSSVRPGAAFPSRRALKEARAKGEGRLVIGGREFDTGLIPVVDPKQSESSDNGAKHADGSSQKSGGWASLMSGWVNGRDGGGNR